MLAAPTRIIPSAPASFTSWENAMMLALAEAEKALHINEVPVGAVVVSDAGKVLGKGHNRTICKNDPTAHAEVEAIRDACQQVGNCRLDNSYLIVTLEPCLMCTGAIIHARIRGLIYGARDPKSGAITSCLDGLEQPFLNHFPWHLGNIHQDACQEILQRFFEKKR